MLKTLAVFQLATFWLKAAAWVNICEHPTRSKPHRSTTQLAGEMHAQRGRTVASSAGPEREAQASGVDRASRLGTDAKPSGRLGVETAIQHPVCYCEPKHASRAIVKPACMRRRGAYLRHA